MSTHQEKFKIKLGLFVLVGLLLFAITIFIIGMQQNLFDSVYRLTTTFGNVSGLQVGNNVRFSGINVGTVSKIDIINDSTVRVDMLIKESVKRFIMTDSEVSIGSEGIIGDRLIIISQGSSLEIAPKNQELASNEPTETDAIIESLEVTAANAEIISSELAQIVVKINSGKGTLGRLIQDTSIADNLGKTMENLKSSTKGLDENMKAAKENVLLRGYFKRKKKQEEKKKKAQEKEKEKQQEEKDKK